VTEYLLAGRYRLTSRIATGGMGEVWRGHDELLSRVVAIKLLPTGRAGDASFLARFRAEARYAASLSHPGIARVYDYGESAEFGGAYLVMELVDGDPLSAILAGAGRLSPDVTLDIISQAARALDAAHEAGIVHRDIKPGNLLVAADGTTKITDFGIATAARAASHLTQTGMVMGTAMYVSPEQATGGQVTAASDLYSLGVVAYECLAGQPPFRAREPLAIAYAHKHEPVPELPPDVPPPVSDLVYQMLAKTADQRPPSAMAVADRADVLRDALAMRGVPGPVDYAGPTRLDLPSAATHGVSFDSGNLDTERMGRGRPPGGRRRRLVLASTTAMLCALAVGVGLYLSGHSADAGANVGSTAVQHPSSSPPTPTHRTVRHTMPAQPPNLVEEQSTPPPSPTASPTPTMTPTPTPTKTTTPKPTTTPTKTPTTTPPPSATPTTTSSASPTTSATGTPSPTSTATATVSSSPSPTRGHR
jgi:eukaryotic-like serine/threonine-protein kinase